MFTMVTESTRRSFSAVAAVAIVASAGFTFDQGHLNALPQGTVEVGELTPVNVMQMASVALPEVVVTGQRVESAPRQVASRETELLPALAVAAGSALADEPGRKASSASVLLK